jgi:hypothetical protein
MNQWVVGQKNVVIPNEARIVYGEIDQQRRDDQDRCEEILGSE